jgi:hypothetical protein
MRLKKVSLKTNVIPTLLEKNKVKELSGGFGVPNSNPQIYSCNQGVALPWQGHVVVGQG